VREYLGQKFVVPLLIPPVRTSRVLAIAFLQQPRRLEPEARVVLTKAGQAVYSSEGGVASSGAEQQGSTVGIGDSASAARALTELATPHSSSPMSQVTTNDGLARLIEIEGQARWTSNLMSAAGAVLDLIVTEKRTLTIFSAWSRRGRSFFHIRGVKGWPGHLTRVSKTVLPRLRVAVRSSNGLR